jgi:hypothetical protein
MDGGSKIAMDGSRSDGQQQRNGWQNGKAIAMGNGTAMATTDTKVVSGGGNDDNNDDSGCGGRDGHHRMRKGRRHGNGPTTTIK